MNLNEDCDYLFKINIIGDSLIGKTSLLNRFVLDKFEDSHFTIKIDIRTKRIEVDNKLIKCQVWDSPSNIDRFLKIAMQTLRGYLTGSSWIIIIYDITNLESFKIINTINEEINHNGPKNIKKILLGTKCDLEDERQVSEEEGKKLADKLGINFFEVSAKIGKNINKAFISLIKDIIINNQKQNSTFLYDKKEKNNKNKCAK